MIFGDGAAAIVLAPIAEGEESDIDLMQTYAGGPVSQVNSITWPNAVVRQQRHGLRSGGQGAGRSVPGVDDHRTRRVSEGAETPSELR